MTKLCSRWISPDGGHGHCAPAAGQKDVGLNPINRHVWVVHDAASSSKVAQTLPVVNLQGAVCIMNYDTLRVMLRGGL